ncbi:methyltransferase domain-containing protein [uncultured Thiocystis sp.]|jgi:SAM-dependent methyltransferase|uniref:methyltransferase domain-containing protein n=1 Tax=uncultured Thiocystis sp. TaxID=1202134 RepID=UPI0025E293AE|nr:methyltransferase domain-containing protein [uncultured Thiocystis sp.]
MAIARIVFNLQWKSRHALHNDALLLARLNSWRDVFPPELDAAIAGGSGGDRSSHAFDPGVLTTPFREERLISLEPRHFDRSRLAPEDAEPRLGRFYPGQFARLPDPGAIADRQPFRVVDTRPEQLRIDLNHPLAAYPLRLDLSIEDIANQVVEHGGRCNEVADLITGGGPGMQARWRDLPTDFWSGQPFRRQDSGPDAAFYQQPRFVDHLDRTAIGQISALHGRLIAGGDSILDLLSSWHSHLPGTLETGPVTGLGMNADELAANPLLHQRLVHDLNAEPRVPCEDHAFDAVICTASVEYLTQPLAVFRDIARVLCPGGIFIVSFSNRWFPPKTIQLWPALHEFERPGLVLDYFLESCLFQDLETWSMRGLPRPPDDKYADRLPHSDPVHAVWGRRI